MPNFSLTPGLADAFALILDGLCRAVAAKMARDRSTVPVLMLLWTRLRRMTARFASLAARAAAGPIIPRPPRASQAARSGATKPRLPQGLGWLIKMLPHEAACHGTQLQHLMAQPEFAALMQAAPQVARIITPLCRLLAVPAPPPLAPKSTTAPDPQVPAKKSPEPELVDRPAWINETASPPSTALPVPIPVQV